MKNLLVFSMLVIVVTSFGGNDDKFIKKYAMMKIYESCFGPEVVRLIRKEMKAACAKCAVMESPSVMPSSPTPPMPDGGNINANEAGNIVNPSVQPSFDVEKLHQAILAYRPATPFQASSYRPYGGLNMAGGYYNPGYVNPSLYQPSPFMYPGYQQVAYSPYTLPLLGQQYFGNRMSKELDFKSQLESLTSRMSGRVRNVTCVMQELGYLDDNLEPNYPKISERIANLPVSEELRRDMQEGVTFCQQFSQCVPEVNKDRSPLSRELIRPMFFFKCYKHKKLEACIMKDVREKYAGVTDEDLDGEMEIRRQGKAMKFDETEHEVNELATSMYDFLYGTESGVGIDEVV